MIVVTVKVFMSAECDRCGSRHEAVSESSNEVKADAIASGWIVSDWLFEGCARQTICCKKCAHELEEERIKNASEVGEPLEVALDRLK